MAFNGTGSNVTSLNASNVASGTLAVARGGTGTASPSLVAGSGISVSGTWPNQTVAAAGGGVTSLNGQTGAITNTNLDAIGSVVFAINATTSNYYSGQTISGSSLYVPNTVSGGQTSNTQNGFWSFYTVSDYTLFSYGNNEFVRNRSGNTGVVAPSGCTALSGTWRCMGWTCQASSDFDPCNNRTNIRFSTMLFVRVS